MFVCFPSSSNCKPRRCWNESISMPRLHFPVNLLPHFRATFMFGKWDTAPLAHSRSHSLIQWNCCCRRMWLTPLRTSSLDGHWTESLPWRRLDPPFLKPRHRRWEETWTSQSFILWSLHRRLIAWVSSGSWAWREEPLPLKMKSSWSWRSHSSPSPCPLQCLLKTLPLWPFWRRRARTRWSLMSH